MNHDYIEQFDLVDRYLMGKLLAEESEQFEEHLVDCPQCIDRLKTTREFMQGLRLLTLEQAAQSQKRSSRFFLGWKTWGLAACCLLLAAAIISILLFNQARRLRLEADQAKSASSEWQRRYEEQQQSDEQRQETERDLAGQVQQLKQDLEKREKEFADAASESHSLNQFSINVPTFVLNSVRGTADVNEIRLP